MTKFRLSALSASIATLLLVNAHAQSLSDLYAAARSYDATYISAKLQFDANLAKADQAKALLLPQVGLSASATRSQLETNPPGSTQTFGANGITLSASQPLFRPANKATYDQGMKQVELSQQQLTAAEQDLIVRVSQAYFDVLASRDNVALVAAQKAAAAEQLASAKRNFEVGTATITDTREAQARFDLVVAQEIVANNDLRVKSIALDQAVGKTGTEPKSLQLPVALPPVLPADMNAWVQQSETSHPNIQLAQLALDVAKLETEKAQAGHLPTVDLVANYGITKNNGAAGVARDYRTNVGTLGVQFSMPLFAGFSTQNRIRETVVLEEKARNDLEGAKRAVAQITRTAFLGVNAGTSQVSALEAAEKSSQSALDATTLGYKVGVRINLDVLNAQAQLFQTKRDLARARYDVLVGGIKLRQANGTLKADDLNPVNSLLAK
jgi:outer membrane protein